MFESRAARSSSETDKQSVAPVPGPRVFFGGYFWRHAAATLLLAPVPQCTCHTTSNGAMRSALAGVLSLFGLFFVSSASSRTSAALRESLDSCAKGHASPRGHRPSLAKCLHAVAFALADRPPFLAMNAYLVCGTMKSMSLHLFASGANQALRCTYSGASSANGARASRAARNATSRRQWSPLNGGFVTSTSCGGRRFGSRFGSATRTFETSSFPGSSIAA
mmetsp:Transcript_8759/g.36999  ORF Transcript_8759/g.36999 Transcript_8759/m.36999 type:complete len:221 (+) Transcript_8759:795-1457(+)